MLFSIYLYKAVVLYDFEGQHGTSELTIVAGETLTVISKDVGEGWWEGNNQRGESGIFPAAYVEVIAYVMNSEKIQSIAFSS